MPAVGGFVFDSSGAPADREVRLYRRDTGDLLDKTRSSGGSAGDPHFDEVTLLLHMDGADSSTTFTDSSSAQNTVTAYGNAKISAAQSKWGGSSGFFDGNGDYLSIAASAAPSGTEDFTLECYCRVETLNNTRRIHRGTGGGTIDFGINADGSVGVDNTGTASICQTAAGVVAVGTWYHIALVRSGVSTWRIFVNGILSATGSNNTAMSAVTTIGYSSYSASHGYHGYIDDLRITKGVARYTASFTPPAARFPDIQGQGTTLALGEYYFATNYTGEVQVVCLDDDSAPLENDLILRTFPV